MPTNTLPPALLCPSRPTTGSRRVLIRVFGTGTALIAAAALCLAALPGSAQAATAIPLATAGSYAVLAGSGITNIGNTTVTGGDLGSSATPDESGLTPCPGTDCVTLTGGANHNDPSPNDGATITAKTDLGLAYVAAGLPAATTVPTELGSTSVDPGVYTSADGKFGITGTLTLDAHNVSGAVFIFQTGSTLTTAVSSQVVLINGADACNVFWRIGSAATLAGTSTIAGTIMAHDAISVGAGAVITGRLLAGGQPSQAGAVTLNTDTINAPNCPAVVSSPSPTATAPATSAATSTPTATPTATPKSTSSPKATKPTPIGAKGATRTTLVAGNNSGTGELSASGQVPRRPGGGVQTG